MRRKECQKREYSVALSFAGELADTGATMLCQHGIRFRHSYSINIYSSFLCKIRNRVAMCASCEAIVDARVDVWEHVMCGPTLRRRNSYESVADITHHHHARIPSSNRTPSLSLRCELASRTTNFGKSLLFCLSFIYSSLYTIMGWPFCIPHFFSHPE